MLDPELETELSASREMRQRAERLLERLRMLVQRIDDIEGTA